MTSLPGARDLQAAALVRGRRTAAGLLSMMVLGVGAAPVSGAAGGAAPAQPDSGEFMPAAETGGRMPGLIVGADALLPAGRQPDQGVHLRGNGGIGRVTDFDTLRATYPDAAVLDCRGRAVLSPGFVNAHEHPAYSYAFPDPELHPGYAHRDEWRLGAGGKTALPIPERYGFAPDNPRTGAVLAAMELRHLLGGATTLAGPGGAPGVIRNIGRHERPGGDPYETVLTAEDEDVLAMWVDGRALLRSAALDARLSERECVTLPGVAPRVCGVLEDLDLSPRRFVDLTRDSVPVNDVRRQAPCEP